MGDSRALSRLLLLHLVLNFLEALIEKARHLIEAFIDLLNHLGDDTLVLLSLGAKLHQRRLGPRHELLLVTAHSLHHLAEIRN